MRKCHRVPWFLDVGSQLAQAEAGSLRHSLYGCKMARPLGERDWQQTVTVHIKHTTVRLQQLHS